MASRVLRGGQGLPSHQPLALATWVVLVVLRQLIFQRSLERIHRGCAGVNWHLAGVPSHERVEQQWCCFNVLLLRCSGQRCRWTE